MNSHLIHVVRLCHSLPHHPSRAVTLHVHPLHDDHRASPCLRSITRPREHEIMLGLPSRPTSRAIIIRPGSEDSTPSRLGGGTICPAEPVSSPLQLDVLLLLASAPWPPELFHLPLGGVASGDVRPTMPITFGAGAVTESRSHECHGAYKIRAFVEWPIQELHPRSQLQPISPARQRPCLLSLQRPPAANLHQSRLCCMIPAPFLHLVCPCSHERSAEESKGRLCRPHIRLELGVLLVCLCERPEVHDVRELGEFRLPTQDACGCGLLCSLVLVLSCCEL